MVQGWYPLGGRGHTSELLGDSVISEIAESHNVSSAQVILRWNLQKGVVVIPGSSNPDHIKENTELYHFSLTDEEMERINNLDRGEKPKIIFCYLKVSVSNHTAVLINPHKLPADLPDVWFHPKAYPVLSGSTRESPS